MGRGPSVNWGVKKKQNLQKYNNLRVNAFRFPSHGGFPFKDDSIFLLQRLLLY